MRKPILAGNWKMNKTRDEAIQFILQVDNKLPKSGVDCIVCAPAIILRDLVKRADTIQVGAQNMNENDKGAYTGEISPLMLKDTGVKYVIVGHSERRAYYNENDAVVNAKIKKALEFDLKPIVCVGENLEERETGKMQDVLKSEINKAFDGVVFEDPANVIVAYEPIWAIGTGKTATTEQAEEACKYIRELLAGIYGVKTADKIRILYGGSMNTKNVNDLVAQPDVDGGLVGGASLDADNFIALCKAF
ncbi:MAG: triose-phosphate isomerase [Acholeplasmatales bacterium]|nr:triose-phosphate isomerase [Acholeplasmatales bacterium]